MSLLTSLLSSYTFESSGSLGADSSGNGNTLTKTGTVPQVAGNAVPGTNGVSWSDGGGVSPAGVLSANVNGIPAASDFAMTIWVKPSTGTWNTTPYDMFVAGIMNAGTDQYGLFLKQSNKNFYFGVSGGGAGFPANATDTTTISLAGVWYFVYCEWDHTAQKAGLSLNNGTLNQAAGPVTAFGSPTTFSIGSDGHGAGFTMDGATDALNLWTRKLTGTELTTLYNGGAGLEYPFPSGRRRAAIIS